MHEAGCQPQPQHPRHPRNPGGTHHCLLPRRVLLHPAAAPGGGGGGAVNNGCPPPPAPAQAAIPQRITRPRALEGRSTATAAADLLSQAHAISRRSSLSWRSVLADIPAKLGVVPQRKGAEGPRAERCSAGARCCRSLMGAARLRAPAGAACGAWRAAAPAACGCLTVWARRFFHQLAAAAASLAADRRARTHTRRPSTPPRARWNRLPPRKRAAQDCKGPRGARLGVFGNSVLKGAAPPAPREHSSRRCISSL